MGSLFESQRQALQLECITPRGRASGDEPEAARRILRDLVTLGFEHLAKVTEMPSKSLRRRLSPRGNPSMDNLSAIFAAIGSRLKVGLQVRAVKVA